MRQVCAVWGGSCCFPRCEGGSVRLGREGGRRGGECVAEEGGRLGMGCERRRRGGIGMQVARESQVATAGDIRSHRWSSPSRRPVLRIA